MQKAGLKPKNISLMLLQVKIIDDLLKNAPIGNIYHKLYAYDALHMYMIESCLSDNVFSQ